MENEAVTFSYQICHDVVVTGMVVFGFGAAAMADWRLSSRDRSRRNSLSNSLQRGINEPRRSDHRTAVKRSNHVHKLGRT